MKVLLGVPSSGSPCEESALASWLCSLKHEVVRIPSCTEGLNFNSLWCSALNGGMHDGFTHFAMMHTDIHVVEDEPELRWIDRLMEEMDSVGADFISTPNVIKDIRGVTSCGIGNKDNRWCPYRRFTTRELKALPRTFNAADAGYPDRYLLHNEALCLFDMRKPLWYIPDQQMRVRCDFNVDEEIKLEGGRWVRRQETEDWKFSRMIAEMGAKSYITSRVELIHYGRIGYSNKSDEISFLNGDENTAEFWRKKDVQPPEEHERRSTAGPEAGSAADSGDDVGAGLEPACVQRGCSTVRRDATKLRDCVGSV